MSMLGSWPRRLARSEAPAAVLLIRLAVGCIFLSEGIQKFLYPAVLGAGRFAKIGIPWPGVLGPFVGGVELAAGILVLLGLVVRPAAAALIINMLVAFTSTKIPILLGHGLWGFAGPSGGKSGFWAMAHEGRTDLAMLLGTLFLLIVGGGRQSLDAAWVRRSAGSR
jgi:putative oxidoreductase